MTTPNETTKRTHRRTPRIIASAVGLFGLGTAAGGIASVATSAGAATTSTSSAAPQGSAGTGPAGTASAGTGSSSTPSPPAGYGLPESGTVTAVGTADVTIKTSTATTTYAVTSTSDIDKNGEATLSSLVVGDAVRFSTVTTNGTTSIDKLHAGNEQLDRPPGGGPAGGPGAALSESGTVTAVGTADVTIKTSTATTTYAVTSTSDIDKNGEATLSSLVVGDAVRFSTVTTNGTTSIDKLHAGNEQLDMPPGGPGPDGGAPPSGTQGSNPSA